MDHALEFFKYKIKSFFFIIILFGMLIPLSDNYFTF